MGQKREDFWDKHVEEETTPFNSPKTAPKDVWRVVSAAIVRVCVCARTRLGFYFNFIFYRFSLLVVSGARVCAALGWLRPVPVSRVCVYHNAL